MVQLAKDTLVVGEPAGPVVHNGQEQGSDSERRDDWAVLRHEDTFLRARMSVAVPAWPPTQHVSRLCLR